MFTLVPLLNTMLSYSDKKLYSICRLIQIFVREKSCNNNSQEEEAFCVESLIAGNCDSSEEHNLPFQHKVSISRFVTRIYGQK